MKLTRGKGEKWRVVGGEQSTCCKAPGHAPSHQPPQPLVPLAFQKYVVNEAWKDGGWVWLVVG